MPNTLKIYSRQFQLLLLLLFDVLMFTTARESEFSSHQPAEMWIEASKMLTKHSETSFLFRVWFLLQSFPVTHNKTKFNCNFKFYTTFVVRTRENSHNIIIIDRCRKKKTEYIMFKQFEGCKRMWILKCFRDNFFFWLIHKEKFRQLETHAFACCEKWENYSVCCQIMTVLIANERVVTLSCLMGK